MLVCPICESEINSGSICPSCNFDLSLDYENFPTLQPSVGARAKTLASRRKIYQFQLINKPYACASCGGKNFLYFADTGSLTCSNCGAEIQVAPVQSLTEFSDGLVPISLLDPELKEKFKKLNRTGIQSISAGNHYYLAVKEDGSAIAKADAYLPDKINVLWENVKNAVGGWKNIHRAYTDNALPFGLTNDGDVYIRDSYEEYELKYLALTFSTKDVPSDVSSAWFLTRDGKIPVHKDAATEKVFPYVDDLSYWCGLIDVAAGEDHVVGLRKDRSVLAAGSNDHGQCEVSSWQDVIAISAGSQHTLGLESDGTVLATGDNSAGQLNVQGLSRVVAISSGSRHSIFLKSDGTVTALGDNSSGQCDVSRWRDIVAISAKYDYSIGLRADGTILTTDQKRKS